MPQLDKITFFSQFFWLSFFYLGFYFLILKYFLPKMSRTLKFRKRRMNNSQQNVTSMGEESDKVGTSYQALLSTGLTTCKSVFNQNFKEAEDWVNSTVSQANQTRLGKTNLSYISSLGACSVSQKLLISQGNINVSEKTCFALLINKLLFFRKSGTTQQSFTNTKSKSGEKAQTVTGKAENLGKNKKNADKDSTNKGSGGGKNKTSKKQ
uniref:H(+)-transporting two-sector ATPase n=1 Tax=Trebouxia lynnae TaxID=1825957 RepID=A0A5J6DUL0_9CHLO|nr:ATP synthase F0 subunit 8 [Trebouxia lynnae]